ncbi:unnamed protein product [Protopolystoma xenopodis]|uniref:Uncharacterized protein n=1 Tax=Protopolystoma xenopodis TaxID=117903 RepID=A0A448XFH8_9PLAT|nr:unnamed protein product [Protopolystoma xenopodis]
MPVDDDNPEYYHSGRVSLLRADELAFPLQSSGLLNRPGSRSIRCSVLGLSSSDEPSTMLAFFIPMMPTCKLCGAAWHLQTNCKAKLDISVGFLAWRQMLSSLPPEVISPPPHRLADLTASLSDLAKQHLSPADDMLRKVSIPV